MSSEENDVLHRIARLLVLRYHIRMLQEEQRKQEWWHQQDEDDAWIEGELDERN